MGFMESFLDKGHTLYEFITVHQYHCLKVLRRKAQWPVEQSDLTEKDFQGASQMLKLKKSNV